MSDDWWKGATFYQIYPRSFRDTTGNGVGDLAGVIAHLDYVAGLGVDGIWLSPFFASPMKDFGYDVSDYTAVDPLFGTMEDLDRLVEVAHGHGLKILIDQVWSHTSDQHAWFRESRQDHTNARADWYVWADAKADGSPPNNWLSMFGGPAWTWDTRRRQYYLHNFLSSQPDLNFHNPDVQQAVLDTARFWLERGIDGFRLDVCNFYVHDAELRDNPVMPQSGATRPYAFQRHLYDKSQPENMAFLQRLRRLLDDWGGSMAVAEIDDDDPIGRTAEYTFGSHRLHTAYNFYFLRGDPLSADLVRQGLQDWLNRASHSWPSWAFSNHDVPRARSRFGGETATMQHARLYMMVLLALRGTLFLFQGEELGLPQAHVPFEKMQDPEAIANWPHTMGRDGCRTPMPWRQDAPNLGFSYGESWLPVDPAHGPLAVDVQDADRHSMLHFSRALIAYRAGSRALRLGSLSLTDPGPDHRNVLILERVHEGDRVVCVFNMGERAVRLDLPLDLSDVTPANLPLGGARDGHSVSLPPLDGLILDNRGA